MRCPLETCPDAQTAIAGLSQAKIQRVLQSIFSTLDRRHGQVAVRAADRLLPVYDDPPKTQPFITPDESGGRIEEKTRCLN